MPWPATAGNRLPLNLGGRAAEARRLVLNLGVDQDGGEEPPGDPLEVIGLLAMGAALRWGNAPGVQRSADARWGGRQALAGAWRIRWGGLVGVERAQRAPWGSLRTEERGVRLTWQRTVADVGAAALVPWSTPPEQGSSSRFAWRPALPQVGRAMGAVWRSPPPAWRSDRIAWRAALARTACELHLPWTSPPRLDRHFLIPWRRGSGLEWIVRPAEPPVEPPEPPPRDGRYVGLNLACRVFDKATNRLPLNLGIETCWDARAQRSHYVILNEISVVRLPDRTPIDVDGGSVDASRDNWCRTARLDLADPAQLALLAPTPSGPRLVEITLNGYATVVAIESYDEQRQFAGATVSVSGRSVSAQLAEPYAAARTREAPAMATMQQLAEAELEGSGVTLDYGTVNWLVPGGAWYYQDLTPMSALQRIAEASGGVVQSHATAAEVQIRARYPVSPWAWTTTAPDVVIQDDIVTATRLQLQSRPLYDAVIVAGEQVGVAARVRREGEAGDTYAPQQIDQLITEAAGAAERGRNVLSDRGGQALIEHELPLFRAPLQPGQPGLVEPLMLVQRITPDGTWHGLVTAVRIDFRRQGSAIDINQTVTIERHYTDAD